MIHGRRQLIRYIAPAAPATRHPATGQEPRLRPEIGFTPNWYRQGLGIDFGERYQTDPAYRREVVIAMREELARRFPGTGIDGIDRPEPPDLLTGTYGACSVAAIYGIPILYAPDNWPNCAHRYLSDVDFFTISNCLVNMVSPARYRDLLLPFDRKIAEAFGCLGIHNCAWTADPYRELYAEVPNLVYIDMGIDSDLPGARAAFPHAHRAIVYTPMDVANKWLEALRADLERIAREYAPCDLVAADIEAGTPDERVRDLLAICDELGRISE
jgi:hypothetical protein